MGYDIIFIRRPTSVFKRIPGERQEHTEMSYQNYDNIDSLDYPHLSPSTLQNNLQCGNIYHTDRYNYNVICNLL